MNEQIINKIAEDNNIKTSQIKSVLKLLEEGNTIPFIARYRKEATGSLDEEQIRIINEHYTYQVNLLKRKEDVIRLIDEKGMLTEELKNEILNAQKLVDVEDLYRPFKEKKKTKATEAMAAGLEPFAKEIMSYKPDIIKMAERYLNDKVKTIDEAIEGAKYIIAEYISDNAKFRKWIRIETYKNSNIISKLKKNAIDETKVYEMYYEYQELIKYIKPHRILALNRGEKENILNVSIQFDNAKIEDFLYSRVIKKEVEPCTTFIKEAIKDSLKRLILPSIEREIRSELTEKAETVAIDNFGKNLEKLLLQPPMKEKMVLGLDPAYRTGCKLAVIDKTGKMIDITVIYPHEPKNLYQEAKEKTLKLIDKYEIDIIAIGNGTASRESEAFAVDVIKSSKRKVSYIIVNEAGASVYSASKLAISEFPDLHVEERSAISIARRLQDPLSELVKIEPKSIGVGMYQHDVSPQKLDSTLNFIVEKAVNTVGVNINTASKSLLTYVSGLTKKTIEKIIDYRESKGKIITREELLKNKVLSEKVYEQSIGFMRILDGNNVLDKTSIHPESYTITKKLLDTLNLKIEDIGKEDFINKLNSVDVEYLKNELNSDIYTIEDIIKSLKAPGRDPRDEFAKPLLKSDILKLEDLSVGMHLQGTVRNVVDFGVFVDIGIKNDGLVHISEITDKYIKHPSEVLSVGDIVDCYVLEIFKEKNKVALTMLKKDKS